MPMQKVSIVIPCYNEEEGIPDLVQQLTPVVTALQKNYTIELVFVDDGSSDQTNQLLHQFYGKDQRAKIITHGENKNLGAALKTGFAHATGDIVATWDSDCTYPLALLPQMLEVLNEQTGMRADIVTVSPYHPLGKVENVPAYRVFLSKAASLLYRELLHSGLYTHSAMVRVYRREVLNAVSSKADNFLYIPEILIKALVKKYRVKEVPATLSVRKYGVSKMKLFNTTLSHLRLMGRIILHKAIRREL